MSYKQAENIALYAQDLSKNYCVFKSPRDRLKQLILSGVYKLLRRPPPKYYLDFWARQNISLHIAKGSTVGIIGRNGSGKSTLLQIISGTLTPSSGQVVHNGRIAALLELGSGFNPEFTGKENVYLNASILGLDEHQIDLCYEDIIKFADIGQAIDKPVKTYSSGMVVRLAFSVAAHVQPDILIVDEALAVGDIAFQARCLDKIKSLRDSGMTTLFVTHDLGTFQTLCDYGYLLDDGVLISEGLPGDLAAQYYKLSQERESARLRDTNESTAPQQSTLTTNGNPESGNQVSESIFHFGTGDAIITSYQILDSNNCPTKTLRVGEKFAVEINVDVSVDLSDLTAAIMFRNAQGQNLFGANTRYDAALLLNPKQNTHWIIRIEMQMLLNPGEYLLHLGLAQCQSDHLYISLDNRDKVTTITVYGKNVHYGLIHHTPKFSATQT